MRKALSEKMGEEKAIEELEKVIENSKMSEEERVESIVERMSREIAENIRKSMTKRK